MAILVSWLTAAAAVTVLLTPRMNCLRWTGHMQDNTIIPVCTHENVSLPWHFDLDEGETNQDIRWKFYAKGRSPELIAMYGAEDFLPSEGYLKRLEYLPNAGIALSHVTPVDSGSYSVGVDVHDVNKKFSEHTNTFHLEVSDFFKVTQDSVAQYNDTTDSWHVVLKCGMFSSMEEPAGVTWMTPSGRGMSTSYKDGYLYLQLNNPVVGGKYTCRLPPNSSTTACLPDDTALSRQPSVMVDETKARLTLLEAENKQAKDRISRLEEAPTPARVAFHARPTSSVTLNSGATVIMKTVLTNEGNAYDASTGVFTVPYNGTYFLAVTASDGHSSTTFYANVEIRVDDTWVCRAYDRYSDSYESSTCHVTVQLVAGQRVWVRCTANNYLRSDSTMFSGFLISADLS